MSEQAFLQHFPDQSGHAYFLIEVSDDAPVAEVERTLRRGLCRKGI